MSKLSLDKKTVAILGGEGFIGRNIAEGLAIDFECSSYGIQKSIFTERTDIFRELNPYHQSIRDQFDVYIHLIDNQVSPSEFEQEELNLMRNVCIPKGAHLIVFSSAVIYANPGSPYGQRKIALEKFYEEWCAEKNVNLSIVRLFNIYGKYQIPFRQGSLVANLLYNFLVGEPILINDMSARRDFMYTRDMALSVRWLIESEFYGKTDLATGKLTTIGELLEILQEGVFAKKAIIVDRAIKEDISCPVGDGAIFSNVLGTDLLDGLKATLLFYEKNLTILEKLLKK